MHPALRPLPLLVLLLAGSVSEGTAKTGVPSAGRSIVPPCLVTCPMDDIPFTVVVQDLASLALSSSTVVIDFSNCPTAFLCPGAGPPGDPYTVDYALRTVTMLTSTYGIATFPLRVGGLCAPGTVRVFADGVLLATLALASPDQDGNGFVASTILNDDPLYLPKVGTNDPTADFDCDGDVDDDDTYIFYLHNSHSCGGLVNPARRSTWGRVKSFYR